MLKKLSLTAFALLYAVGSAAADPINLPLGSPVYFQFNNLEQVSLANNLVVPGYAPAAGSLSGNWGVFNVSSAQLGGVLPGNEHIDIGGGDGFFFNDGIGGTQGQLSGIFWDIDFMDPFRATGGFLDLYWEDPGADDINTACMSMAACPPDATTVGLFTDGIFLARLQFEPGIITGDPLTTLTSTQNPTLGISGQIDAFASVVVGATVGGNLGLWESILNGNWFWVDTDGDGVSGEPGELRDIRFSSFFNATADHWDTAPGNNTGLRSNDPARVFTAGEVPEPATLLLLGGGLVMTALVTRRRKNAA